MCNISKIIKMAPEDHIYWCTLCGPCKIKINELEARPITVIGTTIERTIKLGSCGDYVSGYMAGDCVLFPSKENRDWDRFKKDVIAGIVMKDETKGKYSDFDIVKAKNGSPVRTREGHDVRIICYDCEGGNYPILALVKDKVTKSERVHSYNADGISGIGFDNRLDLVMAPLHCEGYVTIREDNSGNIYLGCMYPTQEQAMNETLTTQNCLKPIKTIKIEFDL